MCWPPDYYLPQEQPGIVMTHIRGFGVRELKGDCPVRADKRLLPRTFFVWCDEEKDAWYFRNCALVLLNQQCYFKAPSARSNEDLLVNREVIRLLKRPWKWTGRCRFRGGIPGGALWTDMNRWT